jgi:SAM-dependent methyltransferase
MFNDHENVLACRSLGRYRLSTLAMAAPDLTSRTIADFGEQWSTYTDNEGDFYPSKEMLADHFGPLIDAAEIKGLRVAEIGAGTGRIANMLLDWGAAQVTAVEPSEAVNALRANLGRRPDADKVKVVQARGEDIPRDGFDMVLSIGVLHHIPDPAPVVRAAFESLAPGGRMVAWVYGHEGNEMYLRLAGPLRQVTTRLPHLALAGLCRGLNVALDGWLAACRLGVPLPMRDYSLNVIGKFSRDKRYLVIYDQLNPAYAKYYRQDEARALLEDAGFVNVRLFHRHEYSWTVVGDKPA